VFHPSIYTGAVEEQPTETNTKTRQRPAPGKTRQDKRTKHVFPRGGAPSGEKVLTPRSYCELFSNMFLLNVCRSKQRRSDSYKDKDMTRQENGKTKQDKARPDNTRPQRPNKTRNDRTETKQDEKQKERRRKEIFGM
jgi:hypothetical protein